MLTKVKGNIEAVIEEGNDNISVLALESIIGMDCCCYMSIYMYIKHITRHFLEAE